MCGVRVVPNLLLSLLCSKMNFNWWQLQHSRDRERLGASARHRPYLKCLVLREYLYWWESKIMPLKDKSLNPPLSLSLSGWVERLADEVIMQSLCACVYLWASPASERVTSEVIKQRCNPAHRIAFLWGSNDGGVYCHSLHCLSIRFNEGIYANQVMVQDRYY